MVDGPKRRWCGLNYAKTRRRSDDGPAGRTSLLDNALTEASSDRTAACPRFCGLESTSMLGQRHGHRPNPTLDLTLALTPTPTLTPTWTQRNQNLGHKRGCGAFYECLLRITLEIDHDWQPADHDLPPDCTPIPIPSLEARS